MEVKMMTSRETALFWRAVSSLRSSTDLRIERASQVLSIHGRNSARGPSLALSESQTPAGDSVLLRNDRYTVAVIPQDHTPPSGGVWTRTVWSGEDLLREVLRVSGDYKSPDEICLLPPTWREWGRPDWASGSYTRQCGCRILPPYGGFFYL